MKNILLLSLFIYSSCALYRDFKEAEFPMGNGKSRATTVKPQPTEAVKIAEQEPTREIKSYRATDGSATLIVFPGQVQVALKTNTMSYREGHSVELKFDDGAPVIKRVLPTDNHIVQFSQSHEVLNLMQGKKSLQVELHLDDVGLKIFTFNL